MLRRGGSAAVKAPKDGDAIQVFIEEAPSVAEGRGARAAGKRKARPQGTWVSAQVVRTLRSGAFEVEVQASKADDDAGDDRDGSEDEDEDDEAKPPLKKVKCELGGHKKTWRYA